MANLANYATPFTQFTTTASDPTAATDGIATHRGARYVHLLCKTSGTDTSVAFEVWQYWSGHDAATATTTQWVLDRSLGSVGVHTISATGNEALLISFEAPGERIAIVPTTLAAGTLLDVDLIEVVES